MLFRKQQQKQYHQLPYLSHYFPLYSCFFDVEQHLIHAKHVIELILPSWFLDLLVSVCYLFLVCGSLYSAGGAIFLGIFSVSP